jgi:uncharacterized membrane-anchored protein
MGLGAYNFRQQEFALKQVPYSGPQDIRRQLNIKYFLGLVGAQYLWILVLYQAQDYLLPSDLRYYTCYCVIF